MKQKIIKIYESNKNYYKKHLTQIHMDYLNETYSWTVNLKEQIYCLRFDIFEQPMCLYDKCNKSANFKGMTEGYGVGACSRKHGQFVSNLKKYGYEMPFYDKSIIDKCRKTCIDNHGVDNPMKSKKISKKVSETKINYTDKQKQQYLDRRAETWKNKYGMLNVFEDVDMVEESMMRKYGVRNISQSAEHKANNSIPKSKIKEYVWRCGNVSKVQGYEDIVLKEIEEAGYEFESVKTKKSDMPEIWYIGEDGKSHRYYPDFYIPSNNTVIEVKSSYTMLADFYTNTLKAVATKALGYKFKLEVR